MSHYYLSEDARARYCPHSALLESRWGEGDIFADSMRYRCDECGAGVHLTFAALYEFDRKNRMVQPIREYVSNETPVPVGVQDDRTVREVFAALGITLVGRKPYVS